jgi:uncharacterized protein
MGKIIFWIVVFFVILFVLRLISLAKLKARRENERREAPKAIPPAEPTVRCAQCGIFLPKAEATPVAAGYRCRDPACSGRR